MARLAVLGALALHLCGAALGPWAHAVAQASSGAGEVQMHPGQLHTDPAQPAHEPCAFCLTVGQPAIAAPPTPTLTLHHFDVSSVWPRPGVQLVRVATTDQARAPPLLQSAGTDRA